MPRDHGAGALNSDHFYAQGKRGWAKRPGRAGAATGTARLAVPATARGAELEGAALDEEWALC